MKYRFVFLCVMMLASLSTAFAHTPVRIIAKDAFIYVRMTKEMLGGNIQVRDSTGHVVSTKSIDNCKMYLDLFELADGKYNVTVQHNDLVVEFSYTVESPQLHARRKHELRGNDHTDILSEKKQVRYA
jgi:hypothetical protein